jgi:MFS family permease
VVAERARAFAFWGASLGIALAVGPVIGGIVTDLAGWRWIFLINLLACAILIIATARIISESKDQNATRPDYLGIVTFTLALALTIWALIDGNARGWGSLSILSRLATSIALSAAFVAI